MKWKMKKYNPFDVMQYKNTLKTADILTKILINRRVKTSIARKILNDPYSLLENPSNVCGLDKAVDAIIKAISDKDEIWIFADYDVDGLTAGFIMNKFLSEYTSSDIHLHYPERTDGYGLNKKFCDKLIERKKASGKSITVITVDNGITAVDEVELLVRNNINVIITDHHEPKEKLPQATALCDAFLDKDRKDGGHHLCGAAIAWKVCAMVDIKLNLNAGALINNLMAYVALATSADVMPMVPENIAIINIGLQIINSGQCDNLYMLLKHLGVKKATPKDLNWNIAPKINSCTRMNKLNLASAFFNSDGLLNMNQIVMDILDIDSQRKQLVDEAIREAQKHDEEFINTNVCVFDASKYEKGIAGIIAGRLADKYNKPAIVLHEADGMMSGSMRSVNGINMLEVLANNNDLINYGGHAEAAGLSLSEDKLDDFKTNLNKQVAEELKHIEVQDNSLLLDCSITLSDVNNSTLSDINKLPYDNMNFPAPVFAIRNLEVVGTKCSKNNPDNICFTLKDDSGYTLSFWGWGMASLYNKLNKPERISIAGKLDYGFGINTDKATFIIQDIKASA